MIRHQKKDRTRNGSGINNRAWTTEKGIDEIIAVLIDEQEFPDRVNLPYDDSGWIDIYQEDETVEAFMEPDSGGFQLRAEEYPGLWKKTEVDFTYFQHPDRQMNIKVEKYLRKI